MEKLLVVFIVLTLGATSFISILSLPASSDSSKSLGDSSNLNVLDTDNSHIVEGVPYVSQEIDGYCFYAAVTMVLQYYGINTTLKEILHHSGVGYTLFYNHKYDLVKNQPIFSEPSYFRYPLPELLFCQSISNMIELASLFNLGINYWLPDQNTCSIELNWGEYWSRVKENITNNIPLITSVNVKYFPYANISSGHTVVIVGFNQTHVFYNDPATALFSKPEDGFYANMSIDIFQKAVNSTPGTKFFVSTFKNNSNINYNKAEVFEKAHERNIKRLKGFFTENYLSINFGINAVKLFRNDFRIGPLHRMFTVRRNWDLYKQNGSLDGLFNLISKERHNVSQYLLGNSDLSPKICTYDGSLLENESKHWKNIAIYAIEFENIAKKYGYWTASILSISITRKMKSELNEIISIEKAIIHGPSYTAYEN